MYDSSYTTTINGSNSTEFGWMAALFSGAFFVFFLVIYLVYSFILGKVFQKAGKPMWAAFVPIYNLIVLLQIVNKPLWWVILFFIPFVNIIFYILVMLELGKAFGKDTTFTILLLIVLPFIISLPIGLAILAFDKSRFVGTGNQINNQAGVPEIISQNNATPTPSNPPQPNDSNPTPPQNLVR